jgi:microcystin-dependent protein
MWSGTISNFPSGWAICNGAQLSIATYTTLYNILTNNGTTFPYGGNTNGSGASGSTHFRLPNMVDRFPVGSGNNYQIGEALGSADAVVVSHSHTGTTGGQSQDHTHSWGRQDAENDVGNRPWPASNNDCRITEVQTGIQSQDHTHNFTTSDAKNGSGVVIGASAVNANLPPYLALIYLIRIQ